MPNQGHKQLILLSKTFQRGEVAILGAVLSVTGQMEFGFVGMRVGEQEEKKLKAEE